MKSEGLKITLFDEVETGVMEVNRVSDGLLGGVCISPNGSLFSLLTVEVLENKIQWKSSYNYSTLYSLQINK